MCLQWLILDVVGELGGELDGAEVSEARKLADCASKLLSSYIWSVNNGLAAPRDFAPPSLLARLLPRGAMKVTTKWLQCKRGLSSGSAKCVSNGQL